MKLIQLHIFTLFLILITWSIKGYSQEDTIKTSLGDSFKIDFTSPKRYEVAGITNSGSGAFDPRMLFFSVGDIIEVPGEEITKSIKDMEYRSL